MSIVSRAPGRDFLIRYVLCACSRRCSTYAPLSPQRAQNESSSSSGSVLNVELDHFYTSLLSGARRTEFIPPTGYAKEDCWKRMNDILESAKRDVESVRLGDMLIFANALLTRNQLTCMSERELVELVRYRFKHRRRFPNILTLIQYLRFMDKTNNRLTSLHAISLTLRVAPRIRLSEMIEILGLLLRNEALTMFPPEDVIDLVSSISQRLADSDELSSEMTELTTKHIVRLVESFFSFKLETLDDAVQTNLIEVVLLTMSGRNCAYPTVLKKMVDKGLDESISSRNRELIAKGIRDHQMSRWRYVESIFEDPEWSGKLFRLGDLTGVDFSRSEPVDKGETIFFGNTESPKGFTGRYTRVFPDLNGAPMYRRNNFNLYFSPYSNCWQISTDTETDSLRVAFISGTPDRVPLDDEGWNVFSRHKSCFTSTTMCLNNQGPSSVPPKISPARMTRSASTGFIESGGGDSAVVYSDEILDSWKEVCEEKSKLEDLEETVISLRNRISLLETLINASPPSTTISIEPSEPQPQPAIRNKEENVLRQFVGKLGSRLAKWLRPEMVPVYRHAFTFSEIRDKELRNEKLAETAKIVSRKFQ
jgi:hypothetical protein